jgi:hypothetical protein
MVEKLGERKQREMDTIRNSISDSGMVSDTELFSRMGIEVKHD